MRPQACTLASFLYHYLITAALLPGKKFQVSALHINCYNRPSRSRTSFYSFLGKFLYFGSQELHDRVCIARIDLVVGNSQFIIISIINSLCFYLRLRNFVFAAGFSCCRIFNKQILPLLRGMRLGLWNSARGHQYTSNRCNMVIIFNYVEHLDKQPPFL